VTLADRALDLVLERGPLPIDTLAPAVGRRRTDVLAAIRDDVRFVHVGKTKGSLWGAREPDRVNGMTFTVEELAARWEYTLELDHYTAASFVAWFIEIGYLESADGNGRVRVSDLGRSKSHVLNEARS
jgi:hypothetical protein